MKTTTVLPFAALLLVGSVAQAQSPVNTPTPTPPSKPAGYVMGYNDHTGKLYRCRAADDFGSNGSCPSVPFIPHGESVRLRVDEAPCGAAFRWRVSERELADTEAGVRGLDQVVGLVASVVPAGTAKGVVPLEGLSVTSRDLGQVVDLLATAEGPAQLSVEIDAEWSVLRSAFRDIREKANKYHAFSQMFLDVLPKGTSGSEDSREGSGGLQGPPGCVVLRDRTARINRVLAQFRALRALLVSDPLATAPSDLNEGISAFQVRLSAFIGKLQTVRSALALLKGWEPRLAPEVRLRMLKRLQEAFKGLPDIPPSLLRDLTDRAEPPSLNDVVQYREQRRQLEVAVNSFLPLDKCPPRRTSYECTGLGEKDPTNTCSLRGAADDLLCCSKDDAKKLDDQVRKLNVGLRQEIVELETDFEKPNQAVIVDTIGPWEKNTIVTVKVFRKLAFHYPDLSALDSTVTTQEARTEASKEAPPADFSEVASGTFEVHVQYRFGVGVGPVLTGLGNRDYAVRQFLRVDSSGQVLPGPEGNPIYDQKLIETGQEETRLDYAVFLSAYLPGKFDSFPGRTNKVAYGATLGFPLNDAAHNVLLGVFLQPTLGCQVAVGLHRGRRTAPEAGIVPGVTVLPPDTTTPPTREENVTKGFLSVILDARIFKKLIGGG